MDREAFGLQIAPQSECGVLYSHEVPEAMKISKRYRKNGVITKKLRLLSPLTL